MNKHAKNLRALPVILPAGTDQTILDVLAKAANEIDRLESEKECSGCLQAVHALTLGQAEIICKKCNTTWRSTRHRHTELPKEN